MHSRLLSHSSGEYRVCRQVEQTQYSPDECGKLSLPYESLISLLYLVLYILTGGQQIMNKLWNENEIDHFRCSTNENDSLPPTVKDDISIDKEHETVPNENVKANQNTSIEIKMKGEYELEITNDN